MGSTLRWLGAAAFTVLVPGTVTVLLPYYVLGRSFPGVESWGTRRILALTTLVAGAALYFRCLSDFVLAGRGLPSPVDHPKRLVVRGPYRYVRNPMYLGVLLILLGEVLHFASLPLLLYAAIWLGIIHVVILVYEEPYLESRFGDEYRQYRQNVRRWIPGRPWTGAGGFEEREDSSR